jgi:hypothetical protein
MAAGEKCEGMRVMVAGSGCAEIVEKRADRDPVHRAMRLRDERGTRRRVRQKQIPFGNDRKKSKSKSKDNNRSPEGMTERKAPARAKTTADSLRE